MSEFRTFYQRIGGSRWLLVLCFIAMFSAYEGGRVLHTRPYPFHLWRQTDCLSITANYQQGQSFLEPEIHSRIADDGYSGLSAGEFPILYWAIGQVWKLTGQSEFVYRLFGILLHFIATWSMFHALRRLLQSDFWALVSSLLLFTSPVIVYYSVGFLTDVPAFDLVLIAWYFMVRYAQEQRRRWWIWAMALFALAALLKVSAGISLVAIMGLLALATVAPKAFGKHRKLLPPAGFAWAPVALALVAIFAWYVYAEGYNDRHNGRYTFNNVWPIWEMSIEEVDRAWTWATQILVFQVFDTSVWLLLTAVLLVLLVKLERIPWPVALLNGALLVGVVAYALLWFHALDSHDYYFINPMIALLVLWATFLWWLRRDHPKVFNSVWLKVAFSVLLVYNVAYAATNMQMRYTVFAPIDASGILPLYHDHELEFWSAVDYYGIRSTLDMEPALEELGIPKDALVIYLDDISINGSLYLMGRKGFTNYGHDWSDPATFERLIQRGASYLMFAEDRWKDDPVLQPYLKRLVAKHRWAYIYDLRDLPEREESEIVFQANGPQHHNITARVDTIACAGSSQQNWCMDSGEYPMEINDLPTYGKGVSRAIVTVKGEVHMEGIMEDDELYLMLAEDDANGQVSLVSERSGNGPIDVQWTLMRQPRAVRNKLFLWNRSGRPFELKGITVQVTRVFLAEEAGRSADQDQLSSGSWIPSAYEK